MNPEPRSLPRTLIIHPNNLDQAFTSSTGLDVQSKFDELANKRLAVNSLAGLASSDLVS